MANIKITRGYAPGTIGRIAELHGVYYHDHWNFGLFFEAKVAIELSEFLKRYDENRDGFWTVSVDGCVEGAIAIDGIHGQSEGAHLRWFIYPMPCGEKGPETSSSTPPSAFAGARVTIRYIYGHLKG